MLHLKEKTTTHQTTYQQQNPAMSCLHVCWLFSTLLCLALGSALCSASLEIFCHLTSGWVWPAADSGNRLQVRRRKKQGIRSPSFPPCQASVFQWLYYLYLRPLILQVPPLPVTVYIGFHYYCSLSLTFLCLGYECFSLFLVPGYFTVFYWFP